MRHDSKQILLFNAFRNVCHFLDICPFGPPESLVTLTYYLKYGVICLRLSGSTIPLPKLVLN